jgi:hypothetical protein
MLDSYHFAPATIKEMCCRHVTSLLSFINQII